MELCLPFLKIAYSTIDSVDPIVLTNLLQMIKTELVTLADSVQALAFYFTEIKLTRAQLLSCITAAEHIQDITTLIWENLTHLSDPIRGMSLVKQKALEKSVPVKEIYSFLRTALTGSPTGLGIGELITMLGSEESKHRIVYALGVLR
jgi:hypothetical protein